MQPPDSKWTKPLLYTVSGFLLFELITGLSIYFLPFSLANQVMILLHTGVGLLFLFPYLWYQYRHWMEYKSRPLNEFVITGYIGMAATLVAVLSGVIITAQALFSTSLSALWKNIHIISTFILLVSVIPHVLLILLRDRRVAINPTKNEHHNQGHKHFGFNSAYLLFLQFALVGLFMFAYSSPDTVTEIPEDYLYHADSESPFAPSLARTSHGQLIDAELMGGSASCGTTGCHSEIYQEWEVSAHRYSAEDPFFRVIQQNMGEQKGAVAARYCGGCHDPVGLFAGAANLYSDELTNTIGLQEGVSCISCHAITEADVQGNADFVIEAPERYIFELQDGSLPKWISDFLIRAYPQHHIDSFRRPLYKTSEYCGACHKQYIDEDVNDVGWVQLQNQYDQWRKSHWYTEKDPISTIECRECHMPLIASQDPSSGDKLDYNRTAADGMHRSHRFLGANQFVPKLLDLPDAEQHIQLIEKWLQGSYSIPEIADKWVNGPAIPITLITPDSIRYQEPLQIDVLITNRKAGHDFPTGPLDMIQVWLELDVRDQDGTLLYGSGKLDEDHFIEPGSFMFKAEPVDQYGNLIDRHNLWEMVGVRYSRALYPGRSDYARFTADLAESSASYPAFHEEQPARYRIDPFPENVKEIHVTARLQYRKINQFLMNEVFSGGAGLNIDTSPVTTISEDRRTVILAGGAEI